MTEHPTTATKKVVSKIGDTDAGMALWADTYRLSNTRFWPAAIKHSDQDGWTLGDWHVSAAEAGTFLVGAMVQKLVYSGWRVWKIDNREGGASIVSVASDDASLVFTKKAASISAALAMCCHAVWDRENPGA